MFGVDYQPIDENRVVHSATAHPNTGEQIKAGNAVARKS
jgi:hypothetical protein